MRRWNLAISGFGTVGWHVAQLLAERQQRYAALYGADVRVTAVCSSRQGIHDPAGISWELLRNCSKSNGGLDASGQASAACTGAAYLSSSGADVLIEAGPTDFHTGEPGYTYIKTALTQGMHAIVISKGALVVDYPGLAAIADERGVQLKISGATAAALPTVDLFRYNLTGCEVDELSGILTGTANFVLTLMTERNIPLADAVREAQRLGIAEANPRFDLDGWDTACKLTILANAVFGGKLKLSDIDVSGIDQVEKDLDRYRSSGQVPKLIGRLTQTAGRLTAQVGCMFYPLVHPFGHVKGATKAIQVKSKEMGELVVIGGASDPRATAAAALKDFEHLLLMEK
ncbi:homoserine dehydrogenase [Brevibacillus humidisoli]|uniref:homoserine dehydrogenase n=1 Tax=Brevibacillus humidisoli TaxID=2895522 RepID=UPI001E47A880|nr:homoserine dehydrogenase [Brevibacillus humidisoli]UFJ41658.1 homoserine dehydrogenase [Brevibacillus humidisoli]